MRSLGSHPGANKFRSIAAVILISIFVLLFLDFTSDLNNQAEELAVKQIESDIRSALALSLYESAVNGQLEKLPRFHQENPFIFLMMYEMLPTNYFGTIADASKIENYGEWYFDQARRELLYVYLDKKRIRRYQLEFRFEDSNGNKQFDYQIDRNFFLNLKELEAA